MPSEKFSCSSMFDGDFHRAIACRIRRRHGQSARNERERENELILLEIAKNRPRSSRLVQRQREGKKKGSETDTYASLINWLHENERTKECKLAALVKDEKNIVDDDSMSNRMPSMRMDVFVLLFEIDRMTNTTHTRSLARPPARRNTRDYSWAVALRKERSLRAAIDRTLTIHQALDESKTP